MNTSSLTITDISCYQCLAKDWDHWDDRKWHLVFNYFFLQWFGGCVYCSFCSPPLSRSPRPPHTLPFVSHQWACVYVCGLEAWLNIFPPCSAATHTCGSFPSNQSSHNRPVLEQPCCQLTLAGSCVWPTVHSVDCGFLFWSPAYEFLEFYLSHLQPPPTEKLPFCLC